MLSIGNINRSNNLSYGQQALWFLQKLAPHSAAYNIMRAARITPGVDPEVLGRSLQRLVDRHPGLRTSFPLLEGKPVQQVSESQQVRFNQIDASSLSWDELIRVVADEAHRPFDLERDRLFRADLFMHSSLGQVLLLTVHHIIVDFLSLEIILDELRTIYTAEAAGREAWLPPIDVSYLDYVDWQSRMLADKRGEDLLQYWKRQLSGCSLLLELPTDFPRKQFQTFRGATHTIKLAQGLLAKLKKLASAERVELYQLLTSAFQLLMHGYSGQKDIVIGYPSTNHRKPEFERVVGFFHNPLPIRSSLVDDPSLGSFLQQTARTSAAAFAHADYPLSLLVERLQLGRSTNRSPIFQVMFVFYESGGQSVLPFIVGRQDARIDFGGAELHYLQLEERTSMLDLTLTIVAEEEMLSASLQYDTDLFEQSTAINILSDLEQLLEDMTSDASAPVSRLIPARRNAHTSSDYRGPGGNGSNQVQLGGRAQQKPASEKEMPFSLFYFSSGDDTGGRGKYQLLLEGARFADRHGFSAVWTPERHFHDFGGIFPNPSITSAALATITERIQLRAGSVVSPLHNPIRLAEDWSVIDNLSNGRVGVSFASGWNASDFVFAPDNYGDRRVIMERDIDIVRRLWRGEAVQFKGGAGNEVDVKILPRPLQAELPVWVTAFGSPETFRLAGRIGANLLTHLLGQSVELLAEKIELYRSALREHGHEPGTGTVTVMMHTFIGSDEETVREKVRAPFCEYLKSSLDLLAAFATDAGIGVDPRHLSDENRDAMVHHAFNRYYHSCALFGTPASCLPLLSRLKAAGVDEIACLIDFGIDSDSVMEGLEHLRDLVKATRSGQASPVDEVFETAVPTHNSDGWEGMRKDTLGRAETRREMMSRQKLFRRKNI
jgi:natural product biosynthesis luciferase-like monooxygenase protein